MEEIKKCESEKCWCKKTLCLWWVKSLLGFFIFLLIFCLGVCFGHMGGGRGDQFGRRNMPCLENQHSTFRKANIQTSNSVNSPDLNNIGGKNPTPNVEQQSASDSNTVQTTPTVNN